MDTEMIEDEENENEIDDGKKHASLKVFGNSKQQINVESVYFIEGYLKNVTKEMELRQIIPNEIKFIILKFSTNTLLIGYGYSDYFKPDSIKIDNIVKCASSDNHSFFVDIKGNVYGIGDNEEYQLGLKHDKNVNMPQLISINANIVEVAAGSYHSILLCTQGCIYTMGWNKYNQCAEGDEKYIKSPKKCEFFGSMRIIQISAGGNHSGIITSDNSVYLFGSNGKGQCGVGKETDTSTPQKMKLCAKTLSCGNSHTLITSTDGKLYACGANEEGQIGNNTNKNQFDLIQINLPNNVLDADCGDVHSLCTLENGVAYSWGHGYFGQLGQGDENNKLVPTQIKVKNIKFKKCVAGLFNSCLIDEGDNFYCFGDNDDGQLCVGDKKNRNFPTKIEKKNVFDIAMGDEYSFIMFGEKQRKQEVKASKVNV